MGSVPGSGTSPAVENGNPLQYFCWEIPWAEEPGGLQLMESQRGRHNSVTNTFTFIQNIAISASHVSCIFLGNLEENIFGFCIDFKCYAVSSPVCYWLDTGCAFLEGLLRTGHGFLFLFFFSPQLVTRRWHYTPWTALLFRLQSLFSITSLREWVCAWSLTYQASENLHCLGMYFPVALFELRCNCDSPHQGGEDEDKSLVEQTRKQKTPQAFRERDFFFFN